MSEVLATHCYKITLQPSSMERELMFAKLIEQIHADASNQVHKHARVSMECAAKDGVIWIARNGWAKLGISSGGGGVKAFISPDLNSVACVDFISLYKRFTSLPGEDEPAGNWPRMAKSLPPSFVLQSPCEDDPYEAMGLQLSLYERCADELIQLLFNATCTLDHSVEAEYQILRKYLHTVYVQLDADSLEAVLSHADEASLMGYAAIRPYSYTGAGSLMGFDFAHATVESRLRDAGYTPSHTGPYRVWRKTGCKPVVATLVSSHTESKLLSAQREFCRKSVSVAKQELPPWFTFDADPKSFWPLMDAALGHLMPVPHQVHGIAMQLQYPQGCSCLFFTGDKNPMGSYAMYSPAYMGEPVHSSVYTVQMLSESLEDSSMSNLSSQIG